MKIAKPLLLALFVFNFLIILFFWSSNNLGNFLTLPTALVSLGRLAGLLAALSTLHQVILIGRSIWIERVFGLDKLSRIHRLNGYFTLGFLLAHPTLLILGTSLATANSLLGTFNNFLVNYPDVANAFLAFLLFVLIIFLSISIIRNNLKYEIWYLVHLFVYLAIFLSFWHQGKNGEDFLSSKLFYNYWVFLYLFVFANHLFFRFFRPWYVSFSHEFKVLKVIPENYNTNSVYISGKNLKDFKIKPGQFMILRFLQSGFWPQAHPFSLSTYPSGQFIRITPKAVGDFTQKIPQLKKGTKVVIDGPLGTFTASKANKNKILLIAGGVGITPLRTLLEEFLKQKRDVYFLNANSQKKDILFASELEALNKIYPYTLINILSNEPNFKGEKGHVDGEKLQRLVKDIKERDVFLCGPPPMMEAVIKSLQDLGVKKSQIHFEKFSL